MGHWMTDVNGDDYYVGETINTPMQSIIEILEYEMLKHETYCHVRKNKYGWWSCECGQFFYRTAPSSYRYCPTCGRMIIIEK